MGQGIEGLIITALQVTAVQFIWFNTDIVPRLLFWNNTAKFYLSDKKFLNKFTLSFPEYAFIKENFIWTKPLYCKICFCFWVSLLFCLSFDAFCVWIMSLLIYKLISDTYI
jgi:hypothetical protein